MVIAVLVRHHLHKLSPIPFPFPLFQKRFWFRFSFPFLFFSFSCFTLPWNCLSAVSHLHQLRCTHLFYWPVQRYGICGQPHSKQPASQEIIEVGIWGEVWDSVVVSWNWRREGETPWHSRNVYASILFALSQRCFLILIAFSLVGIELKAMRMEKILQGCYALALHCYYAPWAYVYVSHVPSSVCRSQMIQWIFRRGFLHLRDTGDTAW